MSDHPRHEHSDAELWRPVPQYPLYVASSLGAIVNVKTGRRLKDSHNGKGYRVITLTALGAQRNWFVHRIVLESFIGPMPNGMQVDHINFDRADNRLENLRYVTPKQNMDHTAQAGRRNQSGSDSHFARLCEADVLAIRESEASLSAVAKQYGIAVSHAGRIRSGEAWGYLQAKRGRRA